MSFVTGEARFPDLRWVLDNLVEVLGVEDIAQSGAAAPLRL